MPQNGFPGLNMVSSVNPDINTRREVYIHPGTKYDHPENLPLFECIPFLGITDDPTSDDPRNLYEKDLETIPRTQ